MASLYTTTLLVVNPPINTISKPYYSLHRHKNPEDELRERQLDTTTRYVERRYGTLLNCSLHMTMKVGSLDVLILQPPLWSFYATCDLITCMYKILWHGSIREDRKSVQLRILLNNVGGFCVLDMSQDEEEEEEEMEEDEDEGYISDSSSGGEVRDDGKNEAFEKLYMTSEHPRFATRHDHEVDTLAHHMAKKSPEPVSPSSLVSSPPSNKRRRSLLAGTFDPNDRNWEVVTAGDQETRYVKDILSFLQCTCPLAPAIPSMILPMGKSSYEQPSDTLHEEDEEEHAHSVYTDSVPSSKTSSLGSLVGRVPQYNGYCGQYKIVAVGGTFDHLHWGHKILLTMAGFLTNHQLIVGITGPDLLKNKEYASELESLETRKARVREYLKYTFPQLGSVKLVTIDDVYGPTATQGDIEALVVSSETRRGGQAINSERIKNKLSPLAVYEINILGGDAKNHWKDKISSTGIRKRIYEAKHQKTLDDEAKE